MIGWLEGSVIEKLNNNKIILVSHCIGYEIKLFCEDEKISFVGKHQFYITQVLGENKNDLYGFRSFKEKEVFEILLKISGIGPSIAGLVMQSVSIKKILKSINTGDASIFNGVKGIGPKSMIKINETFKKLKRKSQNG